MFFMCTRFYSRVSHNASHCRVSEIGCPGARDIRLTAADKYLSHVGQLDILEHETTKYTPNDFIKDLLVIAIDIGIPEVKSNVALRTMQ
jgi:hypothetical protein